MVMSALRLSEDPEFKRLLIMRLILSLVALLLVAFAAATSLHAEIRVSTPTSSIVEFDASGPVSAELRDTGGHSPDSTAVGSGVLCLVGVLLGLAVLARAHDAGSTALQRRLEDLQPRAMLIRSEIRTRFRVTHPTLAQLRLSRT